MPIPLLLWGAAAILAGTGVVKGIEASDNFDKAKKIGKDAEDKFTQAQNKLDLDRNTTQDSLKKLGELKVRVITHQIKYLVDALKKARSTHSGFNVEITTDQLKEFDRLVLNSLEIEKGLSTGAAAGALAAMGAYGAVGTLAAASTGTAIAGLSGVAATNATLAWLGGGSLMAGGYGMAGGMLALGGIVLGPALAIGGFMMASKAEEALTQAREYEAKVEKNIAEMEIAKTALKAIRTNATEMYQVIKAIAERFDSIKVPNDMDETKFTRMIKVGKSLKEILDIPILNKDGNAATGISHKCSGFLQVAGAEWRAS